MLFFLLAAFVPQDAPSMSASEAPKVNICMTKPEGKLDSFDAALSAMERELEAERARQAPDMDIENDDESLDEEDAELLQQLLTTIGSLPETLQRFAETTGTNDADVKMLQNFLESFKAQGGRPGPVSTLSGRLGVGALPRDDRAA